MDSPPQIINHQMKKSLPNNSEKLLRKTSTKLLVKLLMLLIAERLSSRRNPLTDNRPFLTPPLPELLMQVLRLLDLS